MLADVSLRTQVLDWAAAAQGGAEIEGRPCGALVGVGIVSSEPRTEALKDKRLARTRLFDFGAKDAGLMAVTWPVDFFSSWQHIVKEERRPGVNHSPIFGCFSACDP